jgi:hypothetical protein
VNVNDDMEIDCPDAMVVEGIVKSKLPPVAPTLPSKMAVESSLLKQRAKVAVPFATAVPAVMVFAVATPPDDAPNAVELNVNVTRSVFPLSAVSGFVGCVPV